MAVKFTSTRPSGVPLSADAIHYSYGNNKGVLYVWPATTYNKFNLELNPYYWWALGNSGREATKAQALASARSYINREKTNSQF